MLLTGPSNDIGAIPVGKTLLAAETCVPRNLLVCSLRTRNLLCCSARLPQGPVHTVTACDRFRRRFSELTAHHFRIANAKRSAILNIGYVPAINCNLLERMYTRRTISEKFSSFVL